MSRPATWTTTGIRGALDRATTLVRETTLRQAWFDLGWQWIAGLASLVLLDVLVALPVFLRWVGLVGLLGFGIAGVVRIKTRFAKQPFSDEHAARMVEEAQPGLNSALINAVQFQKLVAGAPESQAGLMRFEISRAETAVAGTPLEKIVNREAEKRAKIFFFSAVGIWVAAAILIPGVLGSVLPRLFAPWMDNLTPPYSATKIELTPKGASVRFGGDLVVNASVQGPVPDDLRLATKGPKGNWTDVQLETTEPGKYAITLKQLREDTWIEARGGGARSARYLVKIILPPVASSLEAKYTFPSYTGFKPQTETVGEKGIHGLRDTKVALQVFGNRDLAGGDLIVEPADGKPLHFPFQVDPKEPSRAVASFPITASGKFHVALTATDGQINPDASHGKVLMEQDERPTVWFNQPAQEVTVTPDMKVGVQIEAQDDIGIQRIDLHRVINGIADNNQTLFQGTPVKHTGAELTLDMADLGVRPGDELTYYANAYDNDPGHPNYAQTEAYKIKVLSLEDYEKMLKEQRDTEQIKREINDIKEAIGSLAERQQALADKMAQLEKQLKKNPSDAAAKKGMEDALAEQKKLQDEAKKMAEKLAQYAKSPSGSEAEKALKQKIGEAAKAIDGAAKGPMQNAQAKPGSPSSEAKKAADALKQTATKVDKQAGEAIRNLEKAAPLFNDVERFKSLLNRQGQLVLQSREFEEKSPSDSAGRSKMEAIASEQQNIDDALKQLQEDFRRHAAGAQKDFPKAAASAVKIADEIGTRKITQLMTSAHDGFAQDSGPEGFPSAQKALEQMQAMVEKAGSCQGQCKSELDVKLVDSLGKSGLGQSLGNGLKSGKGADGSGGSPSNSSGMNGGSTADHNPVAYTMSTNNLTKESGTKKAHAQNVNAGSDAKLSPDRVENLDKQDHKPPKASDDASSQYPPEYRKMVRDYFISVTKEKKH